MQPLWQMQYGYYPFHLSYLVWLGPLIIIDLILKGIALWRAGRNNQLYWFIALLICNTLGILPTVYLVFFQSNRTNPGGEKS